MSWREAITVAIVALIAARTVCADMMPVPTADAAPACVPQACPPLNPVQVDWPAPAGLRTVTEFELGSIRLLPNGPADTWEAPTQAVTILSDRQDSLHLCLYAFLGLGLCRSGPYLKRFSFGVIPPWHHDGGPFQIGHNMATEPRWSATAVVCFVQADSPPQGLKPHPGQEAVVCLWRISQFASIQLASRAPPSDAHESVFV